MKPWPGEETEGTASGTMVTGDGQGALEARAGEKSRHAKPQKAPFMVGILPGLFQSFRTWRQLEKGARAPKLERNSLYFF